GCLAWEPDLMQARVRRVFTECCRGATKSRRLCPYLATKDGHVGFGTHLPGECGRRWDGRSYPPTHGRAEALAGVGQRAIRRGKVLQAAGGSAAAGGVCLQTPARARVAKEPDAWTRGRSTSPSFPPAT